MSHSRRVLYALGVACCASTSALSGQAGVPQFRGDYGMLSGTLPPAGAYYRFVYNNYQSTEVVGRDGTAIKGFTPGSDYAGIGATYSFPGEVLNGRWAVTFITGMADRSLELPTRPDSATGWGYGDSFLQPLKLGWSIPSADFVLGSGVWMPTGRFTPGATDNTGLGVWGWEQQLGSTVYLGPSRAGSASMLLSYEVSSFVRGTDRKPGQIITLEGGVGHSILTNLGQIGLDYFAQWKVTSDQNYHLPPELNAQDRRFGLGPEITVPFPLKPFTGIATVRYFIEMGNRVAPQGDSFFIFLTLFQPHVKK